MTISLTPDLIAVIITVLGAITGGAFTLGVFNNKIKTMRDDINKSEDSTKKLTEEVKVVSSKLDNLIGKVVVILKDSISDTLSESNSPRVLNELGKKVLVDSAIDTTLEPYFDEILTSVKKRNPENPYQAQEILFDVVQGLKELDSIRPAVENGAFLSGHSPEEVLYVGALNLRDRIIGALGLQVDDIDKHDPAKK